MEPGQTIGNYIIKEKLGKGVTTSTFLLHERGTKRPAILKVLLPERAKDLAQVERFQKDAKLVSHLRQANIVPVLECGQVDGSPYFISEYVEGKNLKLLMGADGPVPFEIAILFLIDIARGLEYAHEHDVIHGRIRPDNLMLSKTGIVKIANSGLAWEMDDVAAMLGLESCRDKILYASPEQISGRKADARSDLFSLGVVSYELLAVCPFTGATGDDVAMAILEEQPPPLENLVSPIPPDLTALIRRMLEKELDQRCTAADAREDLEEIGRSLGLHRGQEVLKDFLENPVLGRTKMKENRAQAAALRPAKARGRGIPTPAAKPEDAATQSEVQADEPSPDPPSAPEATDAPELPAEPAVVEEVQLPAAAEPLVEPAIGSKVEPITATEPEVTVAAMGEEGAEPFLRRFSIPWRAWLARGKALLPWLLTHPQVVGVVVFLAVGVLSMAVTSMVHHRAPATSTTKPSAEEAAGPVLDTPEKGPPTDPGQPQPTGITYRVECKPVSAIISVDGVRYDGGRTSSFEVELQPGAHTFHVTHPGLRLDKVFKYQSDVGDLYRILVLDLRTGQVVVKKVDDDPPSLESR